MYDVDWLLMNANSLPKYMPEHSLIFGGSSGGQLEFYTQYVNAARGDV